MKGRRGLREEEMREYSTQAEAFFKGLDAEQRRVDDGWPFCTLAP